MKIVRDFDEFLRQLDVITFHVPGGEETKHLLNRERLFNGKCKPNLLVINDARGEVVDEFALADALKEKKIAGAALDVFEKEPPAKDHPLFGLENVGADAAPRREHGRGADGGQRRGVQGDRRVPQAAARSAARSTPAGSSSTCRRTRRRSRSSPAGSARCSPG